MPEDEYEALRRAAQQWVQIASTPQFRQMVEVANAQAREAAALRTREAARAANQQASQSVLRDVARIAQMQRRISEDAVRQAQKAAADVSRARVQTTGISISAHLTATVAAALQPVLDQYIKASRTWVASVQRTLNNPETLRFLQTWAGLAQAIPPDDGAVTAKPQSEHDLDDLERLAEIAELGDADSTPSTPRSRRSPISTRCSTPQQPGSRPSTRSSPATRPAGSSSLSPTSDGSPHSSA